MSDFPQKPPDIMTFLASRYREAIEQRNAEYQRRKEPMMIAVAATMDAIQGFLDFSRQYLSRYRPAGLSHVEADYCIQLQNGRTFTICPPLPEGTMQANTAVPITGRKYLREVMEGTPAQPVPTKAQGRAFAAEPTQDLTLPKPSRDFSK